MVDRPVGHHLEVLRRPRALGLRVVEGVEHRHAFDRLLRDAVDDLRLGDLARFQDRRHDVDDVVELVADLALRLDPLGPVDDQRVAGAAEVQATCLVHWNGASIAQAQPTGTCGSLVGPPISSIRLIVLSRPSCTPSRLASSLNVPSSPPSALAPLSPTTYMTSVLSSSPDASQAVDQPADLVVGVGHVAGVVLHQAGVDLLLVRRPRLSHDGNAFVPRRELGPLGNDAHLQLLRVGQLALLVPAVVELALELLAPLLRRLVRGVNAGRAEVDEPRLVADWPPGRCWSRRWPRRSCRR